VIALLVAWIAMVAARSCRRGGMRERDVRYWPKRTSAGASHMSAFRGESRHAVFHCIRLLLTQNGHFVPPTYKGDNDSPERTEFLPDPAALPPETFPTCKHLNSRLHASAEATS